MAATQDVIGRAPIKVAKRVMLVSALCVGPFTSTPAAEVAAMSVVDEGIYVHSNHPACGTESKIASTLRDKEFQLATAKLFGAKAVAVVVFTSKANDVADKSGGDVSKWIRRAVGKEDHSSCAMMCVRTPAGAKLTSINLSRRSGLRGTSLPPTEVDIVDSLDTSGWRDVTSFQTENRRTVVCATGTNWSHNLKARKVIRVGYNEVISCGKYTKIVGTTTVAGREDYWDAVWNISKANRSLSSKNRRTGTVVTGDVTAACHRDRIDFVAKHGDGSTCACTAVRSGKGGVTLSGNCTCPGNGVLIQGQLHEASRLAD